MVTEVKEMQPLKEPPAILVMVDGSITDTKELQLLKTAVAIEVMEEEIEMEVRAEPEKANSAREVTEEGMLTVLSVAQP